MSISNRGFRTADWGVSIRALVALTLGLALVGCGPNQYQRDVNRAIRDYHMGDFESAKKLLQPYAEKTNENFVLNNVRLGSVALVNYDLDAAEDAFLKAYEVINSVGVNDGGRSLGAILVDEKVKIWKGEPFERAMVNFYLGLVYYMRQDYNNARAAFENALFKLRDYADPKKDDYQEVESTFALGSIMLGRTWQRLGREDLADANFAHVRTISPKLEGLADPEVHARSNLLLVIDFGYGPEKVTDFDGAIVGFAPAPMQAGLIPKPEVRLDGHRVRLDGRNEPPVDLLALAQDRRWQSIDTIRTVKSVVGTGLIAGGAIYGLSDQDNVGAGLAMMGAGLLLKATSQADTRRWEMLPRTVFVLPLEAEPGVHDVTIEFPNASGLRQTWQDLVVPEHGEATYYFRMQRYNPGPYRWPPPAMRGPEPISAANVH